MGQPFRSILGGQWRLKSHPPYQQLARSLSAERFKGQGTIFYQLHEWQATEMGLLSWS